METRLSVCEGALDQYAELVVSGPKQPVYRQHMLQMHAMDACEDMAVETDVGNRVNPVKHLRSARPPARIQLESRFSVDPYQRLETSTVLPNSAIQSAIVVTLVHTHKKGWADVDRLVRGVRVEAH
jgi:hypothetical protein